MFCLKKLDPVFKVTIDKMCDITTLDSQYIWLPFSVSNGILLSATAIQRTLLCFLVTTECIPLTDFTVVVIIIIQIGASERTGQNIYEERIRNVR